MPIQKACIRYNDANQLVTGVHNKGSIEARKKGKWNEVGLVRSPFPMINHQNRLPIFSTIRSTSEGFIAAEKTNPKTAPQKWASCPTLSFPFLAIQAE